MMSSKVLGSSGKIVGAILPVLLFVFASLSPLLTNGDHRDENLQDGHQISFVESDGTWIGLDQPWGQYARTPTHNGSMPAHGPDGGPEQGSVDDVSVYGVVESPVVNWVGLDSGADAYGSVIGDFSSSITAPLSAYERCGEDRHEKDLHEQVHAATAVEGVGWDERVDQSDEDEKNVSDVQERLDDVLERVLVRLHDCVDSPSDEKDD